MQPSSTTNPNPNPNAISGAIHDVYEKIHKNEHDHDDTIRDPHGILQLLKSMRSRL